MQFKLSDHTIRRRLLRPCGWVVMGALWAVPVAQAGNVTAAAGQNLQTPVSDSSPGASASAYYPTPGNPVSWATASRTSLVSVSDGTGVEVTEHRSSNAGWSTNYTLWDLGTNAALDGGLAAGLVLSFNYHVTGANTLPAISLSTAAASYNAAQFSVGFQSVGDAVNSAFGPNGPPPSVGYVTTGNPALLGVVDVQFALLHQGSVNGLMTAGISTQASNAGDAMMMLNLESVTLVSGTLPTGGLGIQLEGASQLFSVSAVPEVSSGWLMVCGLAGIGWMGARRRSVRVRPDR